MTITRRPARFGLSIVTATAIVLGAGVSGAAASPNGPGRSGEAHAEHGHPNPEAVRGHDEEGKTGKGHVSHSNGHGYGHGDQHGDHDGDHHGQIDIVIIAEPVVTDAPSPTPTPTAASTGTSTDAKQSIEDESTPETSTLPAPALASVDERSSVTRSVEIPTVTGASPSAGGNSDGVILRFR